MTHLIYDSDRPFHNDSAGHNSPRPRDDDSPRPRGYNRRGFNGGLAFFAIMLLIIMLFWIDQSRLKSNLKTEVIIPAVENTITRPIIDNSYIVMGELYLHEEPIDGARVKDLLPQGTRVTLLGESHQAIDGDAWLKVSVETFEGTRVGWVRQRYVV